MAVYDASRLAQDEYYALKATGNAVITGMSQQSLAVYLRAVEHARAASRVRGERGVVEAVQMMAEEGVHAYTYTRRDGTLVRVPGDVAMRRAVTERMGSAVSRNAYETAKETGHDLVYIPETPACRKTHEPINGKAFSVTGRTPGYDVLDDGLLALMEEPNCQHRMQLYWPGITRDEEPAWRAAGYTDEQMRDLRARQRSMENGVRKAKRSVEALKAAGMDTRQANAVVRARQARLRELIAEHPKVLRREVWREALYDSHARMQRVFEHEGRKAADRAATKAAAIVSTPAYAERFAFAASAAEQDAMVSAARKMIARRSGTRFEDIAVIAAGGTVVATVESGSAVGSATMSSSAKMAMDGYPKGSLVIMHNHPQSMYPSAADFEVLSKKRFKYGVIACHDGTVLRIRVTDWRLFESARAGGRIGEIDLLFNDFARYYGTKAGDARIASMLERRYGVTYERYA